jgi:hypothetical protein
MSRNSLVLFILAVASLTGCGSPARSGTKPGGISVIVSSPSALTIAVGAPATVSATVSNDRANAGVTWSCAPTGICGSFSPTSTASGASTTYTAPKQVPTGGQVTISAASVTDGSKQSSVTVAITLLPISVAIIQAPPQPLALNATAYLSAIVNNDPSNSGVNWSCTPAGGCGSFIPTATASLDFTVYTAPNSAPADGMVTLFATSNADRTKSASAGIVVSQNLFASLQGQYAFFLSSPAGTRGTASLAGSITLAEAGAVTAGVLDIVSPAVLDVKDPILPTDSNSQSFNSSYDVDASGRGHLNLVTANGQKLIFSLTLTSLSHALLTEIDGNPGSGTLELQQRPQTGFSADQVSGAYSFTMMGAVSGDNTTKVSMGGEFTADGSSSLHDGVLDVNTGGVVSSSSFTGSYGAPDSNGRGNLILGSGSSLTYYIISPKVLRVLEADTHNRMGGSAYSQGNGILFIANNCFYQHSGWSSGILTTTVGEFFIPEADVAITSGISDSNIATSPVTAHAGVTVTGSASDDDTTLDIVDAAGHSDFKLYLVDQSIDLYDPTAPSPNAQGVAGNALLLHTDAFINGTGILILTRPPAFPVFSGTLAVQLTNSVTTSTLTDESDLVGLVPSDGSANLAGGLADYDRSSTSNPVPVLGASVGGSFTRDTHNPDRFTGNLKIVPPDTPGAYPFTAGPAFTFSVSYYQISPTQAFVIGTDASTNASGILFRP